MRRFLPALLLALVPTAASAQQIVSGSISTAGADCSTSTSCLVLAESTIRDMPSFGLYINVAASGTFNFEATIDDSTWIAVPDDVNGASSQTADGARWFTNPGYRRFRIRASAISGAATVTGWKGWSGLRSTATLSGAAQGDGALQDGANSAIEATVFDLTNSNPLATQIVDANGSAITSFGGGTQYTEGDAADTTMTGTVAIMEISGNLYAPLQGSVSDGLLVNLGTNNDVTVTGTVTATASNLDVQIGGSDTVAVSNAGTFATQIVQGGFTATVRDLASDALNVAIVDAAGAHITSFGGGTQYTEDVAAATDPVGTAPILVRADTPATAVTTAGDNVAQRGTNYGAAYVQIVTSSGAFVDAFGGSGGTAIADDVDFADGTTIGTPIGGVAESASPTTVTEGDFGWAAITLNRALKVTMYTAAGVEVPVATTTEATHATTLGTITSVVGPVLMGNASSATPTDVGADGDAAAIWLTRTGAVNVADGGGTLTVDGTVTVTDGAGALNMICDSGCGAGTVYDHGEVITLSTANAVLGAGVVSDVAPSTTGVANGDAAVFWVKGTGEQVVGGAGSAGAASGGVLTIQGSSGMVTVATNPGSGTTAYNWGVFPEDLAHASAEAGSSVLSVRRDTPAASANNDLDYATFNTDENGGLYTNVIATNAGGATPSRYITIGSGDDEHAVCTGPCNLYSVTVTNTNAAVRYLKCENDTTAGTAPGTDTPELGLAIPGAATGGGFTTTFPVGAFFSTALTCWVVTGATDADATDAAASEIMVFYTIKQ